MRSICSAVVRPVESGGSASREKNAASLVSMLGASAAARELTNKEHLVDGIEVVRPVALAVIVNRGEL